MAQDRPKLRFALTKTITNSPAQIIGRFGSSSNAARLRSADFFGAEVSVGSAGGAPVTITISNNTGATYSGFTATYGKEGAPTTNYNTDTTFETTSYASGDRAHGYLLATGLANVSAGTVTNARIRIRASVAQCNGVSTPQTIELYRLLSNQVQTEATWNRYSVGNNWTTAGGLGASDANLTALAAVAIPDGGGGVYYEWSGTAVNQYVSDVINGVNPNYGLLSARNSDTAYDFAYVVFNSDNATDGFRPELIFDWVAAGGSNVSSSYDFAFGVNNYVSSTYDMAYVVMGNVASTYDLAFAVRNNVASTYDFAFGVNNYASSNYDLSYVVFGNVASTYDLAFSVINNVSSLYDFSFIVQQNISSTYDFSFVVQNANSVSSSYDFAFGVNNYVNSAYDMAYVVMGNVASTYDLSFAVRNNVASTYDFAFGVLGYVNSAYDFGFTVRNFVASSYDLSYLVNGYVASTYDLAFLVRNYVASTYDFAFAVASTATVSSTYDLSFAVRNYVAGIYDLAFAVRNYVASTYGFGFSVNFVEGRLTQAIKEAYASAPVGVIVIHTLEFRHPSFRDQFGTPIAIRAVLGHDNLEAKLEADAPQNAGEYVTFIPMAFDLDLPNVEHLAVPEIVISIDNVSREIEDNLTLAAASPYVVEVTYRPYLNTDLTEPQMNPPLTMTLVAAEADDFRVTARATYGNVANILCPREVYNTSRFPGIQR